MRMPVVVRGLCAVLAAVALATLWSCDSVAAAPPSEQCGSSTVSDDCSGSIPTSLEERLLEPISASTVFTQEAPAHVVLPEASCPGRQVPPLEEDDFTSCIPAAARCRRMVIDESVVDNEGAVTIVGMMNAVLREYGDGGGAGAVSLVDLNAGVVSLGEQFVSLVKSMQRTMTTMRNEFEAPDGTRNIANVAARLPFSSAELDAYSSAIQRIHEQVSMFVYCDPYPCATQRERELALQQGVQRLFLAKPSFFSRIVGNVTRPPQTVNDEHWHSHIDREQYGSFAVTTLLYLGQHVKGTAPDDDVAALKSGQWPLPSQAAFTGGRFVFGAPHNMTVEPRLGRLSAFTSGSENPHWVEQVGSGVRYALTTAFTCSRNDGFALYSAADAGAAEEAVPKATFLRDVRRLLDFSAKYFR